MGHARSAVRCSVREQLVMLGFPAVSNHTACTAAPGEWVSLEPNAVIESYKKDVDRAFLCENLSLRSNSTPRRKIAALRLVEEIRRSRGFPGKREVTDFEHLLAALVNGGVEFIIGGMAAMAHGLAHVTVIDNRT